MNDLFGPIRLLIFLALFRMSYEAANLDSPAAPERSLLVEHTSTPEDMTAAEKEWAEKAVQKYADAQGKKWRHWNEAMFER